MSRTDWKPDVGDPVVYEPFPGGPKEDGVVTGHSANGTMVFVRYRNQMPDAPGKATRIDDLAPAR